MEKLSSKLSVRQLSLFFFVLCPLSKLLVLPSMMFYVTLRDAYLVVLIWGVVDIIFLTLLINMMSKTNLSVSKIIEMCVGKVGSRVVVGLYGLLFVLKSLVMAMEESDLSMSIVYEGTGRIIAVLPIFLVLAYAGVATVNSSFRTVELFAPFVIGAMIVILFLSVTATNLREIFPIMEFGGAPIAKGVLSFAFWFGDFIIIIPLLNDIRLQRKFRAKIIGSYAVNVAIVAVFFVVIIGVFGVLAPRQLFFISKISRYSVTFSSVGRVDFIFLCALILGMILWCACMFMLGINCLSIATGIKRAYLTVPIVV
ncbi:MAG: GerAB/ArcD/ProY family transporter, partial [Clostridia bacterium]